MSISRHIPANIRRASRSIGLAAWADTTDGWHGLATVLAARLEPHQRAGLAWAALKHLPPEYIAAVAETVLPDGTDAPIAPLISYMDEAAFWADMAEPDALDAYCLATFNAMHPARQAAFLDYIADLGRAAA